MRQALQEHTTLCADLLLVATQEEQCLRNSNHYDSILNDDFRRNLSADLDKSLDALKTQRMAWQGLSTSERERYPDISRLIRSTQEVGMKLIVLDRENEQGLLRRGLLPARQLPSAQSQRPNYVAGLYQRHRT